MPLNVTDAPAGTVRTWPPVTVPLMEKLPLAVPSPVSTMLLTARPGPVSTVLPPVVSVSMLRVPPVAVMVPLVVVVGGSRRALPPPPV